MEQIRSILEKIEKITANTDSVSTIEKDLMLRYTRDLYEAILAVDCAPISIVPLQQELTEEPEPLPEEVIEEDAQVVIREAATAATEEDVAMGDWPEQELPAADHLPFEKGSEEYADREDGVEHSVLYADSSEQAAAAAAEEEEEEEEKISFELEPELQEEKPASFQVKSRPDFRVWNKDIRTYIGINDKYNFISELFKQNSEAYEEILNEINQCDNKPDALRFLENAGITTLYQWNEDGFSEQIFYNVLSQFFASR
jgi:hypothetical protein